eukprot:3189406-Alexandrium_andersonii.AAC.1
MYSSAPTRLERFGALLYTFAAIRSALADTCEVNMLHVGPAGHGARDGAREQVALRSKIAQAAPSAHLSGGP